MKMGFNFLLRQIRNKLLILIFFSFSLTAYSQNDFNTTKGFGCEIGSFGKINYYTITGQVTYKIGRHLLFIGGYVDNIFDAKLGEYGPYLGYRIYPHKNIKKIKIFYQSYFNITKKYTYNNWIGYFLLLGAGIQYEIMPNINVGTNYNLGYGYVKSSPFETGWNWWLIQPNITISYKFIKK